MAKSWPPKDPNEVLEYGFNWSPRGLGTDTITAATGTVVVGGADADTPAGLVADSTDVGIVEGAATGQGTVTWLSGGVAGTTCEILLRVQTEAGRTLDQTMTIKIKDR